MSVFLPIIGIAMIIAKFMNVSYMEGIDWWWCAIPFVLAFIYWEFVDSFFHFSGKSSARQQRRRDEKIKRAHIEDMLSDKNYRRTKGAGVSRFHRLSDDDDD